MTYVHTWSASYVWRQVELTCAPQRGGTFTDCVGNPGSGRLEDDVIIKLLSVDPQNYDDAPLEGIRRLLVKFTGKEIHRGEPLDTSVIGKISFDMCKPLSHGTLC